MNSHHKPPKQAELDAWEGEGGAVATVVFGRPRPLRRRVMTRLECAAFSLKRRIRERPLEALAMAIGIGLFLGGASRNLPTFTGLSGLPT